MRCDFALNVKFFQKTTLLAPPSAANSSCYTPWGIINTPDTADLTGIFLCPGRKAYHFLKQVRGGKGKSTDWAASWCLILELAEYTCVWRLLFTVNQALCGAQSKVSWTSREMSLRHRQSLQRPATSLLSVQLSQQTLIFWKEQVSFHTSYWCVSSCTQSHVKRSHYFQSKVKYNIILANVFAASSFSIGCVGA